MGLTILDKLTAAPISRNRAYCLLVKLPTRVVRRPGSIIVQEIDAHWERVTSGGRVVRCHTELEAQEAAAYYLHHGLAMGQWIDYGYDHYDPRPNDLPYYDWIRGVRKTELTRLGIPESALPEAQDPSLARMSDAEWTARGPR